MSAAEREDRRQGGVQEAVDLCQVAAVVSEHQRAPTSTEHPAELPLERVEELEAGQHRHQTHARLRAGLEQALEVVEELVG